MKPEVKSSMKLGCSRTCLRGASIVVVGSRVRGEWNGLQSKGLVGTVSRQKESNRVVFGCCG